ncbi:MAG: TlpA family protein disulfide reductase [Rikenellaceae bacterium]|nr:TlpA family protein disulfide reductase [Rikenellaceae bacterium]
MIKFAFRSAIATVVIIAVTACVNESNDGDSIITEGDTIPAFSVSGPYGTVSSGDFDGRGGIILLFASYCDSCRELLPEIEKLWDASDNGTIFTFAALSRQTEPETPETVAAYWQECGYTMPYYLDTGGEVYYRFAGQWIPRVYVVGSDRRVTYMSVSNSKLTAREIADEIEKALGITIDL